MIEEANDDDMEQGGRETGGDGWDGTGTEGGGVIAVAGGESGLTETGVGLLLGFGGGVSSLGLVICNCCCNCCIRLSCIIC